MSALPAYRGDGQTGWLLRRLASPWWLLSVAALLRVLAIVLLGSAQVAPGTSFWGFGHEAACLGASLLRGEGFGDPWGHGTGPSAWLTPPYPAWLALCVWIGGGAGPVSAWWLLGSQALAAAATALVVQRIANHLAASRAALLAGWIFAFHPLSIWFAAETVWDTTFVALGLSHLLWLSLGVGPTSSRRQVLRLGIVMGLLLFLNPAVLSTYPVLVWFVLRALPRKERCLRFATLAFAALLPCMPWMLRNAQVLGSPGLRTNFGVELRVGNLGEASGRHDTRLHPSHSASELERYRALGEVAYSRQAKDEFMRWVRANPLRFGQLCTRRLAQFWLGEPPFWDRRAQAGRAAQSDPKAWLKWLLTLTSGLLFVLWLWVDAMRDRKRFVLALSILGFSLPYLVTHVSERYRFPVEPLIVVALALTLERFLSKAPGGEAELGWRNRPVGS